MSIFGLGRVVATPGALERAQEHGISLLVLIKRHSMGDWGNLDTHDKKANEEALKTGARLLSSYGEGDRKIWIITDASPDEDDPLAREVTTILRPEDY